MKTLTKKDKTESKKNTKKNNKPAQCCAKTSSVKAGCHD
jgi:hypothetical protein